MWHLAMLLAHRQDAVDSVQQLLAAAAQQVTLLCHSCMHTQLQHVQHDECC